MTQAATVGFIPRNLALDVSRRDIVREGRPVYASKFFLEMSANLGRLPALDFLRADVVRQAINSISNTSSAGTRLTMA